MYEEDTIVSTNRISRLDYLFINPFIVEVRNNHELTILSFFDCETRAIFKLDNCKNHMIIC